MGGLLSQYLNRKFQKEQGERANAADFYEKMVLGGLSGQIPVSDQMLDFAAGEYSKLMPKQLQSNFAQWYGSQKTARSAPPGGNQPITVASQAPPQTMDRSPVPAIPPPPVGAAPPQSAGGSPSDDTIANPVSSAVAPAAPAPPPPGAIAPTASASSAAPAMPAPPSGSPLMMTPAEVFEKRTAPLLNAQTQDLIRRYESTTGRSFRDLSPEWQQFVLTGKEFRPSPIALAQYEEQLTKRRIDDLKATGDWDKMSPRQRAEIRTGAKNVTPELRPQNFPGMISGKDVPESSDALGNPIDKNAMYRMRINPDGSREYVPEVSTTHEVLIPDDQSSTKVSKIVVDRLGNPVGNVIRDVLPPPGYTPRETTQNGIRMVTQPDGSIVAVPVTTRSVSQPIIPGSGTPGAPPNTRTPGAPAGTPQRPTNPTASAGPPGRVVGGRPLPETTKERMDAQLGAYNNTLQLITRVQQNLPILNSMLSAGKIQLATTPEGLAQIVSRASNLSDQEAQMAADMQSLAEHINTIRGPLGATGFRGHEAFGALQAQRGQVLGNPKVTAAILKNTSDSLIRQKQAIERSFKQHGIDIPQNEPTNIPPPPSGGTVKMKAPNGQVADIPVDQVEHYKAKGAVVVQ